MVISDNKTFINVLNAAVKTNDKQIRLSLQKLMVIANHMKGTHSYEDDLVVDLIDEIKVLEKSVTDATEWFTAFKSHIEDPHLG